MPINFDQVLQYQFALFFEDLQESADLKNLPAIVGKQQPSGKALGLKLGRQEREEGVLLSQRAGAVPRPVITWKAGSGIWKLTWTPERLDLYFDAIGFQDVVTEKITLTQIKERVAQNLAEIVKWSSRRVNRLALIVTAKATPEDGEYPNKVVAKSFFNQEVIEKVDGGKILDLSGRLNYSDVWDLAVSPGGSSPIRINKIETGASNWNYEGKEEQNSVAWQLDVNTSPVHAEEIGFGTEAVPAFLDLAERWISERLHRVGELSG